MKFQRALHRIFSLKRFFKMSFKQETKISPFANMQNLDKVFFVQKKRKTNSFIKYSNILNNGLPYTEYFCRSNKLNRAGISENFSYQIRAVWV